MGGPLLKKVTPRLEECAACYEPPPHGTMGRVIVASVCGGSQLDHTDVWTHPGVLNPSDKGQLPTNSVRIEVKLCAAVCHKHLAQRRGFIWHSHGHKIV